MHRNAGADVDAKSDTNNNCRISNNTYNIKNIIILFVTNNNNNNK